MDGQISFTFEQRQPIKGYPELHWTGKRAYETEQFYPAQLKEVYGNPKDGWMNKIFWGDNLQVMGHLLQNFMLERVCILLFHGENIITLREYCYSIRS